MVDSHFCQKSVLNFLVRTPIQNFYGHQYANRQDTITKFTKTTCFQKMCEMIPNSSQLLGGELDGLINHIRTLSISTILDLVPPGFKLQSQKDMTTADLKWCFMSVEICLNNSFSTRTKAAIRTRNSLYRRTINGDNRYSTSQICSGFNL